MRAHLRKPPYFLLGTAIVFLPLLMGSGCGNDDGSPISILETWSQFQSGISSEGFIAVDTELAVPPLLKWEVEVGQSFYGFGSPVIGPDGTIYVGTLEGELVAISPDGEERWRRTFLASSTILSTPAVAPDGSIFVVVTNTSDSDIVSTLNRVSAAGDWTWSVNTLAEGRKTTSSPKVFDDFVFLYVPGDVAVYDFDGNLVSQGRATQCEKICGSSSLADFFADLVTGIGSGLLECTVLLPIDSAACWDNFKVEFDGSVESLPPADPTVAIVSTENVVGDGGPIVIALNSVCITGFRFNAPDLEPLWQEQVYGGDCGDDPVRHGSPAIVGGGLLVTANVDGEVIARDPVTGDELWKYESDEDFLSTPTSFVRPIYVASTVSLHLLNDNGTLISKRPLLGFTQASVALSSSHAYLSTSEGLFTYVADPGTSFTVDGDAANRTSTPAIGDDGTVYALTDNGTLRAYSPGAATLLFLFQAVEFTQPVDGASLAAGQNTVFSVDVTTSAADGFNGETSFSSDIDGDLCVAMGSGPGFSCEAQLTTLGEHVITAVAIDASGTIATDSITVQVVNGDAPPTVTILSPNDGAVFGASEVISFAGTVSDPNETIPDANISWTSDQDGLLGTSQSISVTLSEGTHVVTLAAVDSTGLRADDTVTIQVNPGEPPTVQISSPTSGSSFLLTDSINFQAQASDTQDGTLTGASLVWVSDVDGTLGTGENLSLMLSQGSHTVTVTATNSLSLTAQDSVAVTVIAGPGVPVVTISSPTSNTKFGSAQMATLVGSATDPEDASIPESNFQWSSDIDGILGTGTTLQILLSSETDPCNTRTHIITLEVTDSDGNTTSQQITIRVGDVC